MSSTNTPVETTPVVQQPTDPAATTNTANDISVNAMMLKMADQQQMITDLNDQLVTKNKDVETLSAKSRAEMQHLYHQCP